MRNILMVLKPREIDICVDSINALKIDKVWFEGFKETEVGEQVNEFVRITNYHNYIMVADDVIVEPKSLASVQELLTKHYAATAYCNCWEGSEWLNIAKSPLTLKNGRYAEWADYNFFTPREVEQGPEVFKSWFGGWMLTGMRRDVWIKYPFRPNPVTNTAADFECSYRMNQDGLYFLCHKDSFNRHLKIGPQTPVLGKNGVLNTQQVKVAFHKK